MAHVAHVAEYEDEGADRIQDESVGCWMVLPARMQQLFFGANIYCIHHSAH